MPANPLPILIFLALAWIAIAIFLFRRLRWAGATFIALSLVALGIHALNMGVKKQIDEQMSFRLLEIGDYHTLELTTSHGNKITTTSPALLAHLQSRTNQTVRVIMTGWYDYGRLRSFRIQSVDGITP